MKGRITERERDPPIVSLPVSHRGGRDPVLGPASAAFLGTFAGSWIRRGVAETQTGFAMGCGHHKQ